MANKTFTIKHARTNEVRTIKGSSLKDALEKAELTSIHWHEIEQPDSQSD